VSGSHANICCGHIHETQKTGEANAPDQWSPGISSKNNPEMMMMKNVDLSTVRFVN
jgi:hypothetical protein